MNATRYAVIDFETTGLIAAKHLPIEIAGCVLDESFRVLSDDGRYTNGCPRFGIEGLLLPDVPITEDNAEHGAMELHTKNGLLDDLRDPTKAKETIASMTEKLGLFFDFFGIPQGSRSCVLVGNNPEFDRGFLQAYFPSIASRFHYRSVNVSSLREVASVVSGAGSQRLKTAHAPTRPHRAAADVEACVSELHTYARAMAIGADVIRASLATGGAQ
jgi:oligoribonuclease